MNKQTILLSDDLRAKAEQRMRDEGFESLEAYVGALINDDAETSIGLDLLRQRIEEGLASGNAGPVSREKVERLIGEGIARVTR